MRLLITLALALSVAACGRGAPIQTLPLAWTGVKSSPRPGPTVAQALASVPISFGLRDVRPDPTVVGSDERSKQVIQTGDNVAAFASTQMGDLLRGAGGRFEEAPVAAVEADLTEFNVIEGGRFNGTVTIRVTVSRGGQPIWAKVYRGTSRRWGRTHSPEKYNEALSHALFHATKQLVQDEDFGAALMGIGLPPPPPMPAAVPPAPGTSGPAPPSATPGAQ